MRNKHLNVLVGLSTAVLCVLISLYIIGAIKLSVIDNVIDNIIVKTVVTIAACVGFLAYISLGIKKRHRRRTWLACLSFLK